MDLLSCQALLFEVSLKFKPLLSPLLPKEAELEQKKKKKTGNSAKAQSFLTFPFICSSPQLVRRPYISLRRREPSKTQRMWSFSGPRKRERPGGVLHVRQVLRAFQFFCVFKGVRKKKKINFAGLSINKKLQQIESPLSKNCHGPSCSAGAKLDAHWIHSGLLYRRSDRLSFYMMIIWSF